MSNYIYEPSGRAREYAALALNSYVACGHGCLYCYVPLRLHKKREVFHTPRPRRIIWNDLRQEAARKAAAGWTEKGRVLLSFMCDPYQQLETAVGNTRLCIGILKQAGFDVIILTKAPGRAFRDIGQLDQKRDMVATTMATLDPRAAKAWEPSAPLPFTRLAGLKQFDLRGFYTWISLEPLLDPRQARHIIRAAHFAQHFKLGMLNYGGTCPRVRDHAAQFDWPAELSALLFDLQERGYTRNIDPEAWGAKTFYLKQSVIKELEKCQK